MPLIARETGSVLLSGLNSFWKRFFRDSRVLDLTYLATESLLGDTYLDLMEAVLSKSLRNTPVLSKRDWKLLILSNSNLSFDEAIFSFATSTILGPELKVTAIDLNESRDGVAIEVADSLNLSSDKKILYPSYGTWNVGLVTDVLAHEQLWVLVVPTGETISDSLSLFKKRQISNKRIESFEIIETNSIQDLPLSTKSSLTEISNWNASTNTPTIPAATSLNNGNYYVVTTAGTTDIDGITSWDVGDWVVSIGDRWVKAALEPPIIEFRYGTDFTGDITIPTGVYADIDAIKTALESAIALADASLSFDLNLTVEVDGAYLIINSDKELLVWNSNSAYSSQLYLRAFRFSMTASIPPGREAQFPWDQTGPIQLLTSGYREAGTEYRFPIQTDIVGSRFIYNTLFDPSLAIEEGVEYRIDDGFIYFKDNPFEYDNVAFRDFGNGKRELALWMSGVSIDKLTLYLNFGYRFTALTKSSEAYKNLIRGIYFFYTQGPQLKRIESAFNILAGIPVVIDNDETVQFIAVNRLTMTTDKNEYVVSAQTPISSSINVGDVLQAFDPITDAFQIEDYITNPTWFDQILIPEYLMPGAPVSFRISNATTSVPDVGDPGFIVGDGETSAVELITNPLESPFTLSAEAFFAIERDNNGSVYSILVPTDIAASATSLADVVTYLRIALKQFFGNPVDAAGASTFELLTDAVFTIVHGTTEAVITVTAAETSGFTALSQIASLLESKIDAAIGAGKINVFGYLTTNSLALIPTTRVDIALKDLNVSAATELGLFQFTSLTGISVSAFDDKIRFASTTVGSESKVEITQMNAIALTELEFEPFRTGSGDIIGEDGDPSPGYDIMDKYLKYNTFRIKFNANTVTFDQDVISIQDIILSGRPLYTAPLIAPDFQLIDVIEGYDGLVEDIDAFLASIPDEDTLVADVLVKKKGSIFFSSPDFQLYRKDPNEATAYITLAEVHAEYTFENASTDGGQIFIQSVEENLVHINHFIELVDIDNLKAGDVALYSNVGIFNRGLISNGIEIPAFLIPSGDLGGVYAADVFGDPTNGHWVDGFDKADMPATATHVFVIDQTMKTGGLDPFAQGITEGDFLSLRNFSDGNNDGDFPVLKMYRNVHYRNEYVGLSKVLVDIIVYENNKMDITPNENYRDNTIPLGATIAFRTGSNIVNKSWLIVLPNSGDVSQRVADLLAAVDDNKDIFPFNISYIAATPTDNEIWNPPTPGTYYDGYTFDGDLVNETFRGELHNASYATEFEHNDPDAQPLNPTPSGSVPAGTVPDYNTVDTMGVAIVLGNIWGIETYDYDTDAPGQLSRNPGDLTNPYLLGQDDAGVNIYVEYDSATKLDSESFVKYGEMAFSRGIQYHFTDLNPNDTAEYYGPNLNVDIDPISTGPIVWPSGDTSTYRSFIWKGYWIAIFDCFGTYETSDPNMGLIGGGSPPSTPAPAGYTIGEKGTLWTLEIGATLSGIPGTSLPLAADSENCLFQVLLRSNTPHPDVNAPAETGLFLFEHLDWIYSDGVQWQRIRYVGTNAEQFLFNLGRQLTDAITTGEHVDSELTNIIGAGPISCGSGMHNYLIWTDSSLWTKVIGGKVLGSLVSGGWYDFLIPNSMLGYGPQVITNHHVVETDQDNILNSDVVDWSQDTANYLGPHYPFLRVYEPGGTNFILYIQVPEASIEEEGITISLQSGVSLSNTGDAIGYHLYDQFTSDWSTPSNVNIAGANVTQNDFTLRLHAVNTEERRLRLFNQNHPNYLNNPYDTQSGILDDLLYVNRQHGFALISLRIDYTGTFGSLTDYLRGIVISRKREEIVAA